MKQDEQGLASVLELQLASRPILNRAVRVSRLDSGGAQLSVPLQDRTWANLLRHLLPLSEQKNMQLDPLGSEILARCDGEHTVEALIDWLQARWQLSFFEARGMVLHFLRSLMKDNVIVLVAPSGESRR